MKNADRDYHVHISARHAPFRLGFSEVWQYRDLIWLFTKRNFQLIYKQTILGPLWLILRPLATGVIYTVIFGGIAGLSTAGVPKILFYLSSQAFWSFFSGCLMGNSSVFLANASVFRKVYFPRLTIALSNVLSALIQFLIQMGMVAVMMAGYLVRGELHPNWGMLPLIPLELVVVGLMGLGLGILVSSVTTKYRDLSFMVGFALQMWMYLSPVVYPASQLPLSGLDRLMACNPMTAPLELFRKVVLGVGTVRAGSAAITILFSLLAFLAGILTFNKVERTFIDTV